MRLGTEEQAESDRILLNVSASSLEANVMYVEEDLKAVLQDLEEKSTVLSLSKSCKTA